MHAHGDDHRGEILLEARPLAAMEEMRGRIWRSVIENGALAEVEREHAVISTRLLAGRSWPPSR